jgi:hypothetical protein
VSLLIAICYSAGAIAVVVWGAVATVVAMGLCESWARVSEESPGVAALAAAVMAALVVATALTWPLSVPLFLLWKPASRA